MPVSKKTKKTSSKKTTKTTTKKTKKTTSKKQKNTHYIEVSAATFAALEHLKMAFEDMTNTTNMEYEDVINVLVQGFVESVHADQGCCGSEKSCGNENCACE